MAVLDFSNNNIYHLYGIMAFWGSGGSNNDDEKTCKECGKSDKVEITELSFGGRVATCYRCNYSWTLPI